MDIFGQLRFPAMLQVKPCNLLVLLTLTIVIVVSAYDIFKTRSLSYEHQRLYLPERTNGTNFPEDSFSDNCQRHDLHVADEFSPFNQTAMIRIPKNVECPRVIKPANVSYPSTGLMSFPGSGNTWVRHLIQQLTGLPTASLYLDMHLLRNGFPFENRTDEAVAVKSHGNFFNIGPDREFERVILVIRNVYESIVAEIKREMGNHTANVYINTEIPEWQWALRYYSDKWYKFMEGALSFNGPILLVFYEDLKTQLGLELERMAKFLKCGYLKEFSLCCALQESEGAFHRTNSKQGITNMFNKDARMLVNKQIVDIANFIKSRSSYLSQRILSYRMHI